MNGFKIHGTVDDITRVGIFHERRYHFTVSSGDGSSLYDKDYWTYKERELEYDENLMNEKTPRPDSFKKLLYCYDKETSRNIKIDTLINE